MKVALLGATGFVGSALLKEALDRGHMVTAIVRHPERLEKREGLTAKAGDVYDTASLATLIRGNEAIISVTFGLPVTRSQWASNALENVSDEVFRAPKAVAPLFVCGGGRLCGDNFA
jgi:putative NADH-flavin reductase